MNHQTSEHLNRLRDAAAKAITEDDVRLIFQRLVERAKNGDREAIRTVMAYLTPPPEPAAPGRRGRIILDGGTARTPQSQRPRLGHKNGNGEE